MFESRCGVPCNSCERKEDVHCQGCLQMDKPFWGGDCAVKACCESKSLDHCGVCPDFPCDRLAHMGTEEGFDPEPKLTNCRKWAAEV